jgi:Arc/MetJ-type ribon-helix-helix transcriptional regulator
MSQPKVTLKIPKPLYDRIKLLIDDSGFNSVTDFVVFVLRDVVYLGRQGARANAANGPAPGLASHGVAAEEMDRVKEKLRELGYL